MPGSTPQTVPGLEVWLRGTRAEVNAAIARLAALGHVIYRSEPHRLHGADAGHVQVYVRIGVHLTAIQTDRRADQRAGNALPALQSAA